MQRICKQDQGWRSGGRNVSKTKVANCGVDGIYHHLEKAITSIKTFVTLGIGVLATELLDYSVFAGWHIAVRDAWMGPFFTGLMVGALTYVWPAVISAVGNLAGRGSSPSETRTPRAA